MANLLNQNIGTNYKGILNLNTLNGNLSGTLQAVTDGDGNTSPLTLSTGEVGISRTIALSAGSSNVRLINETYTINNSGAQTGTATGIFLNATETALNGMTHNLMDLQVGGVSRVRIENSGSIYSNAYLVSFNRVQFNGGTSSNFGYIMGSSNGVLRLTNAAENGFDRLQFGGTTNAFPALKRNAAALEVRLADDSGFAALNIGGSASSTEALTVKIGASYGALMYADGRFTTKGSGKFGDANGYDLAVASAILQADSTTKGFLPPRMTTTQVNGIATPAEGLVVFNTTISNLCVYQSGAWVKMSHSPM